jgi:ferredoxin
MAKRKIIKIDLEKCNGCGACIPDCPEGALKMIDGKARLISDLFCDGLGACIGSCPQGAITIEEREAQPYDEKRVMENIIPQGPNVIKAHLEHLKQHQEWEYLRQAIEVLREKGEDVPDEYVIEKKEDNRDMEKRQESEICSQLRQWPIQLHLISPTAPYYQGKDVLLVADCVAYALGNFHQAYLKGKSIAIACPKLDGSQDIYIEKIRSWFDDAKINTLSVMIMQVPCCRGLLEIARKALNQAKRKVPIKEIVVGIKGEILSQEWV